MRIHPTILGIALFIVGTGVVVFGMILAFEAYQSYTPSLPQAQTADEAIGNALNSIVILAVKIGFLAVMMWGGGILLRHGVGLLVEGYKADTAFEKAVSQQKQ